MPVSLYVYQIHLHIAIFYAEGGCIPACSSVVQNMHRLSCFWMVSTKTTVLFIICTG